MKKKADGKSQIKKKRKEGNRKKINSALKKHQIFIVADSTGWHFFFFF